MIFILEGIDKVGKSTLAKSLCKQHKAKLVKVNAPKTNNAFQEYIMLLSTLKVDKNYVLDRFYLGEMAYGPIYRGKSTINETQQFYLESLLLKFNPTLIYCWLDYNELCWNFQKDGEEFTKFEDVPRLTNLFNKAYERSILKKCHYNYNKKNIISPGIGALKLEFSYAGHLNPSILFVGDEPNYRLHLIKKIPYAVFNSTSGMFLFECLKRSGLKFGVINSKEGNKKLIGKDLNLINPELIIYLGDNAAKRCKSMFFGLKINHPQHAKRFYGKDAVEKYTEELKCYIH